MLFGSGHIILTVLHKFQIVPDFRRYFPISRACIGVELWLSVLLNVVSAFVESIGILLFIPFLAQRSGPSTRYFGRIPRLLAAFLTHWNIPTTIGYTLESLVAVFLLKGATVFLVAAYQQRL